MRVGAVRAALPRALLEPRRAFVPPPPPVVFTNAGGLRTFVPIVKAAAQHDAEAVAAAVQAIVPADGSWMPINDVFANLPPKECDKVRHNYKHRLDHFFDGHWKLFELDVCRTRVRLRRVAFARENESSAPSKQSTHRETPPLGREPPARSGTFGTPPRPR